MLIKHIGGINIPEGTPTEKIRLVASEPRENVKYLVVSSVEEAKEICPELFIEPLTKSEEETMAMLRKESEFAKAIDRETESKIRAKYSIEAELKALRTNDQEYKTFIEQVVAEHNAAKDALFSL